MAITAAEIQYRLSGGASNSDHNASLGGVKSSTQSGANLFDAVTSAQATSGLTEYRCVYVHNANATLDMLAAKIWIASQTPSADTSVEIGLGTSAIGATEQTVANEATAPSGVTFSTPASFAAGLTIGDVPAGSSKAVWIKRIVTAGAAPATDGFTLSTQCDSNP